MGNDGVKLWGSEEHHEFAERLDDDQAEALRDLLLLATLADDVLTNQERVDVAVALGSLPGLETLDFDSAELIDYIDDLYAAHAEEAGLLVADLLERLGEDRSVHLHAFRIIIDVMKSHGLAHDEERFAREIATILDLEDELVERLIEEAANGEDD